MLLFLLPLLFNPFGFIAKLILPAYLASWPVIIHTFGKDILTAQAVVIIIFILTCDITRKVMLRTLGFDLISFPVGIAVFLALFGTDYGLTILSILTPLSNAFLSIVEPIFLLLEVYLILDMVKGFNKWISTNANVRDEESQDLSNWEPPLTRSSISFRILIILITISGYFASYWIIHESKLLFSSGDEVPAQFNQAIAALVTLQLIALSATIYKEEGVLSESAMVAIVASLPIFVASWSFYHLNESSKASSR